MNFSGEGKCEKRIGGFTKRWNAGCVVKQSARIIPALAEKFISEG
jgi:hypothetical protein